MGTSANVEVRLLVESRALEQFTVPIHIRENIRIGTVDGVLDLFVGEQACCSVAELVEVRFVVHAHVRSCIHKFRRVGRAGEVAFQTETNDRLFGVSTALGGYDHHTVRTACTVHGSCRRVLQDGEAFNHFRVEGVQVCAGSFHTVEDD